MEKISHEEYLKEVLDKKKRQLNDIYINNKIAAEVFNVTRELIQEQIDDINFQLYKGEVLNGK